MIQLPLCLFAEKLTSIATDFQIFQDKYTDIEKEKIRLHEKQ